MQWLFTTKDDTPSSILGTCTWVALPPYLREFVSVLDNAVPLAPLEHELRVFSYGGELEEITGDDQLDSAKGRFRAADNLRHLGQLIEELTMEHGDCETRQGFRRQLWSDMAAHSLSSTTKAHICNQHAQVAPLLRALTLRTRESTLPHPKPIPAQACTVVPPTLHAAKPVMAVTATAPGSLRYFLCRTPITWHRRTDFPVPVPPQNDA
ncbi:hypothetical protein K439DRAFT_1620789 [Ramaria rubella]|nr:hypothetical protein K439DRAFT_1620789 [Ramaria rubella]